MQILRNASIKRRLMYIIMSISTISVLLTTLIISVIGVINMRDNLLRELAGSAAIVGASNASSLEFDGYSRVPELLGVLSRYPTIIQACLYDYQTLSGEITGEVSNQLVTHYINKKFNQDLQCTTNLAERKLIDTEKVEIMQAIYTDTDNNKKLGYIYIESTLDPVTAYIRKQTFIAFFVAVAGLIVSYLLAISLQRAISAPILRLADTAKQVSLYKDYSIRAKPIGDPAKEFNNELVILTESFNVMLTEIGDREQQLKKQNVDLEKAKDAAEAANRAKSQFLANISHELRTPLNAIIGFSSILMNQLFGPLGDNKYLEYSKDINESGAHLLDIINDILDLSKAEAGKLSLNYEEVHVGKSINKCMTILAERAEKGKITITTDIPKMLPPLVADRLRFIQILLNILSNAVKFTDEDGKVHIGVKTKEIMGEVTHFVITVQDSGIGMSQEDLEKAFQSFGQVDSGLNRKYEGTGLGLPLTRKLMELHYATIHMDSELGKGTLVTLTFPALPPVEAGYIPAE
jgi:signal transduction histidine kinase